MPETAEKEAAEKTRGSAVQAEQPGAGGDSAGAQPAPAGSPAAAEQDSGARGKAKPSPFASWRRGQAGSLDLLRHSELRYSTDGLEFIRTIVRILVIAMFICATVATYVMKRYVSGNSPAGTFIIVFCWSMPIIIYLPLSVIFHIRKSYLVRLEKDRLIYRRYFIKTEIPLQEIDDALDTKPVIRDRNGVWIPKRHGRILLSEIDTLPGLPYIEQLCSFLHCRLPEEPAGSEKSTIFSLGLILLLLISNVFVFTGFISPGLSASHLGIRTGLILDAVGILFIWFGSTGMRSRRYEKKKDEGKEETVGERRKEQAVKGAPSEAL